MRGLEVALPAPEKKQPSEKDRTEKASSGKDGTAPPPAPESVKGKAGGEEKAREAAGTQPGASGAGKAGAAAGKAAGEGDAEAVKAVGETVRTPMSEEGEGECYQAYGVEVVELLEMEPVGEEAAARKRPRAWNRYASAALAAAFVLGLLNAGASLIYQSVVLSPGELLGDSPCELAGEVRDLSGAPLVNATVLVTTSDRSALTNAEGWYILKGIPPGTHTVEATADGYNRVSVKVDLRPNLLRSLDFTLERGGSDVSMDESASLDLAGPSGAYLWAVPAMIAFSCCALASAILLLRRPRSHAALALGAAGALSFGFGPGSALALAGVILATLQPKSQEAYPRKRLRVGIAYPRAPAGKQGPPARKAPAGHAAELPEDGAALERLRKVPAVAERGEEEGPERGPPPVRPPEPLRAKRYIRRSSRERLRCCVCIDQIAVGHEYIRCVCGRTVHVRCLQKPECPSCGHGLRREKG